MYKLLISIFCLFIFTTQVQANEHQSITSILIVDNLCKQQSEMLLIEQGIDVLNWSSQHFNGDRTFNIEGFWQTNNGDYIIECELPFANNSESLTLIINKV